MRILIDLLYMVALVLYSPRIIYRMLRQDRYRAGWSQRMGNVSRRRPEQKCIWIHAVSVGEVNATKTLVQALRKEMPEYEVVITATTDTGLARAKALYEQDHAVFYFPFDVSWIMARAMKRLRPSVICLMELEVWPNLASRAKKKQIPVVVVNGRISDRSFPKYLKLRRLVAPMFRKVSLVLAQTAEYAERFVALGCGQESVVVTNSLKYDTAQIEGVVDGANELARQINLTKEPLWVAGGTGPGEEEIILDVFAKLREKASLASMRLAIVPRKPERFDEVAELINKAGFGFVRYRALKEAGSATVGKPTVILGDTMGDLKKFYALATVVFVGRTLVPMGGSDMMEPVALGKCTLFGPHTFNFKQTVEVLLAGQGALLVNDAADLYDKTLLCLMNKELAQRAATNGQNVIRQNQGATQKTIEAIQQLLEQ